MAAAPRAPDNSTPTVIMSHPQSAVQAGIAVAHDAVGSLGAQPVLLLIVVINIVFIATAGFFLAKLEGTRSTLMMSTLDIIRACVLETAPLGANREKIDSLERNVDALQRREEGGGQQREGGQ